MSSNSEEIEATLIIRSENPQAVVSQIAGLTSIGNYRLLPQDPKTIHDLYFDTPNGALRTHELALRVRAIGAAHWITLKGPSRPTDWGGMERLEIEAPWSRDTLTNVVRELANRGIELMEKRQGFDRAHPLEVMSGLGLIVIQDRETHRQIRNIVSVGAERSAVLAELAIDYVVYHFSDRQIGHHEVEIEAKAKGGSTASKTVIENLVATYGPALRRWDHGKLATGRAIERMLRERALQGLVDANDNLKPGAYDLMSLYNSANRWYHILLTDGASISVRARVLSDPGG
jgi:inorganic triphosphatase YgiF